MTLALLVGVFVVGKLSDLYRIGGEHVYDLGFYIIVFGLLGARLYHVLNEPSYYLSNPSQIIAFWNGGLALHGGIIGGALAIYWYVRKHFKSGIKIFNFQFSIFNSMLLITDIIVPALALGQAIGRWGNYFNQELFGLPTNLPWGIPIELSNRVAGFESFTYFHPTFLYESLLNVLIFVILMFLHKSVIRNLRHATARSVHKGLTLRPGVITATYIILYSIVRIAMEFLRVDATPVILGIRLPIIVSSLLIIAGLWFLYRCNKPFKNLPTT